MDFFPYDLRPYQRDIMDGITQSLRQRQPFIFESGTGSGKTVCTLAACLTYALANKKRIVYTTRTNAQQQQVIRELRTIRDHTNDARLIGVGLQGRANLCLLAHTDPEVEHATAEELSRFCSYQKKLTHTTKEKGCPYYRRLQEQTTSGRETPRLDQTPPTHRGGILHRLRRRHPLPLRSQQTPHP